MERQWQIEWCAGLQLCRPVGLGGDDYNNINNVNANNNFNNNGRSRGIASLKLGTFCSMKTYKRLFPQLVSMENLEDAYWKARKRKSNSNAVLEFDKHWQLHLATLHRELKTKTYKPRDLKTFILRDPKTRKICKSDFRDRVVHHAVVKMLQPIFEPRFIQDSFASRKGMPLGNWTSQFFANIYLNELDQFAKNQLKAKYYLRYVDDFVILHTSKTTLQEYEQKIKEFLSRLKLELHPTKCKIIHLAQGVSLLGFRAFYHHKLVTKRNIRKIHKKLTVLLDDYETGLAEALDVFEILQGWNAYAMHGNTYKLRQSLREHVEKELVRRTSKRPIG